MNYIFIAKTMLFHGMTPEETEQMLGCLSARTKKFDKNQTVCSMGEPITDMGLILSGSVNLIKHDVWGNQAILEHIPKGQVFGEAYACLKEEPLMIDVIAAQQSEILFLNAGRIMETCPVSCSFHSRLIRNLVHTLAKRNLTLTGKMDHITPRTIRDRVLAYLSAQAVKQGSYTFDIPFNRQQLADYLSVDRSALSAELSKLQKENLICFRKNKFTINSVDNANDC